MKSLMLLPMLALTTTASAGEFMVGVGGGVMVMDKLETLGDTWEVVPRFTYFFNDTVGVELDPAIMSGTTRRGDHSYLGVVPRINFVGRLWNGGVKRPSTDENGNPMIKRVLPPIRPLLVAGIGGFYKKTNDDGALGEDYVSNDLDFVLSSGPGLLVPFGKDELFHIRTDLRWVLNFGTEDYLQRGDQFVNWEWNAGVGFAFGGVGDSDGDGIVDGDDRCIDKPEDKDGFQDEDGCPEDDNDEDGVLDADDQCPNPGDENAIEDMDDFEDTDGCTDPDNDMDGILDGPDACPTVAGKASAKGCPDDDEDGIVNELDECVDEAGPLASFGCPDDDEDLVPNYRDNCPDEPAPAGADPMISDGCPAKVFVTADSIKILDKVFFDVGRATIKAKSNDLLDEIAKTLINNANIKKVQIEGHTDNTGDDAKNKALSQARAESVVAFLVADGVEAERLVAMGFGEDKPLTEGAESDTKEGRAKNRRVEFNITEQEKVTTVFTRAKLETNAHEVEGLEKLTVTSAQLPKDGSVTEDATCVAVMSVNETGTVETAKVSGCVALPRSITRRTLKKWTFEPYTVEGAEAPTRFIVDITMTYAEGKASVVVDEKTLAAVDEETLKPVE